MTIDWTSPRFVQSNGIRMGYFEAGKGIPVVLCHGFPELAYSWRYQIPALAQANFRVIAPDQRGFGSTQGPSDVDAYDIHHLTGDLIGLLDALGIEKAVFAGHDWGGIVTWSLPLLHSNRVAGIVGVNTPFMPRPEIDPIAQMRAVHGDDMYIVQFQQPQRADEILARDTARTMRFFFRKSPTSPASFDARPRERRNMALLHILQSDETKWPGHVMLSPQDLEYYVRAFERTGFTGGINWYRNYSRNWQSTEGISQRINCPALMVMAENDIFLRPSAADGMERYVPDLEKHLIKDCGHWTQMDKPAELNQVMTSWLLRRFG